MIYETSNKNELFAAIDEAVSELIGFISSIDEKEINTIPYENSWTAGQLIRHITKSTNGMAKAMRIESKPVERNPGEKIQGLRKTFLDFSSKMQSPDFIVPEEQHYEKQAILNELTTSFEEFQESTNKANLHDIAENLPLGTLSKLELLHFVLYHTQRHLNQMKKIYEALQKK